MMGKFRRAVRALREKRQEEQKRKKEKKQELKEAGLTMKGKIVSEIVDVDCPFEFEAKVDGLVSYFNAQVVDMEDPPVHVRVVHDISEGLNEVYEGPSGKELFQYIAMEKGSKLTVSTSGLMVSIFMFTPKG